VAQYRYLAIDWQTLRLQGELPVTGVSWSKQQNGPGSFSGLLDRYDSDALKYFNPQRTLIGVERAADESSPATLEWVGMVMPPKKAGTSQISCEAVEIHGLLSFRHIRDRRLYVAQDSAAVVRDLVNYAQTGTSGTLHIQTGTELTGIPISQEYNFDGYVQSNGRYNVDTIEVSVEDNTGSETISVAFEDAAADAGLVA
jgi:hypothetical protein